MAEHHPSVNRRDFMKKAAGVGATLGVAAKAFAARPPKAASPGRVLGANDRINVAGVGVGGGGPPLAKEIVGTWERPPALKHPGRCGVFRKRPKRRGWT